VTANYLGRVTAPGNGVPSNIWSPAYRTPDCTCDAPFWEQGRQENVPKFWLRNSGVKGFSGVPRGIGCYCAHRADCPPWPKQFPPNFMEVRNGSFIGLRKNL